MIQKSGLGRGAFLTGLGGAGVALSTAGVNRLVAPQVQAKTWSGYPLLRVPTGQDFANMRAAGLVGARQGGVVFLASGKIMVPQCDITVAHPVKPLDCDPSCQQNGNCDTYEPGGRENYGYPVIGTVVANPALDVGGFQTGLWTGTYSLYGGYLGEIPQHGWGAVYQFNQKIVRCISQISQVIGSAVAAAVWCAANVKTVGTIVALASEKALAAFGRGAWAATVAAEFFGAIISVIGWPEFLIMLSAISIGLTAAVAVASLIECVSRPG